ncbi:Y-family DNA polymerase [Caulifigura coniformis]|nr:DNA polymerase Y family protein [Caulifigura coniformis]
MPRILCVWLPLWPIQRLRSERPEARRRPLALLETTPRGERLAVCSPAASRLGLRPGMSRAEAEILAGHPLLKGQGSILLLPMEPEVDRQCLHELALRCRERFSPMTAMEEGERPECLFLDLDGCEHLFGGEPLLVRALVRLFRAKEWRLRCAVADTVGAAWALAHYASRSIVTVPSGATESSLTRLPLAALRLPGDALHTLGGLGIEDVGQLLRFARAELASRFEPIVVQRIRQALGIDPELLIPVREPEPIVARWASEEATCDQAALEIICGQLLTDVLDVCRYRGIGLLQCLCRFEAAGQRRETYTVELVRPAEDARHVLNLLVLQWEQRPFPGSVHSVWMEATRTMAPTDRPGTLFDNGLQSASCQDVERLIERLSSRLGRDAVLRASLSPDAQPEFSVAVSPWIDAVSTKAARPNRFSTPKITPSLPWERPATLLAPAGLIVWSVVPDGPPQRVRWKDQLRSVTRWWGPEWIETGWWERLQCHREYYRVELETGEWLWIFRDPSKGDWFLNGVFD